MEKHKKDKEEVRCVPSTKLIKIRVTWKDTVTNTKVLKHTGQRQLQDTVGQKDFGLQDTSSGWHQNAQLTVQ